MDTPLSFMLPIVGFIGGIFLWTRVVHMTVAISGNTPDPTKPQADIAELEAIFRRLVFRIAAAWLVIFACIAAYLLYRSHSGFAALFLGITAVPLFTVAFFLVTVRKLKQRVAIARADSQKQPTE